MKKIIPVFSFFLLLWCTPLKATHIMGMDLQWKSLGSDTYNITVVIYRRCTDGAALMNNPGLLITSDSCATTYNVLTGAPISYIVEDITPTCVIQQKPCPISGGNAQSTVGIPAGIERHTWVYKVFLGGSYANCCWYKMRWQLCCRNSNITIGLADADFYSESWLNRCLNVADNSPVFAYPPIEIRCAGQDVVYNHGVFDVDGDSLSFNMSPPLGGNYLSPWSYDYPLTCLGGNNPNQNANPPTGFNLNSSTGDLSFRPMQVQITVLKTMVTEWRKDNNGNYKVIGKTARDMQFIIMQNCNNKLPTLLGPYVKEVCVGNQVCFTVNSNDLDLTDSTRIYWNKAIPAGTWLDSNGTSKNSSGTFCWTPTLADASVLPYFITVLAEDNHCPLIGKASRSYSIKVIAPVKPTISKNGLLLTSSVANSYQWYLNNVLLNGAINQTYNATQPGYYKVKTTQGGCSMTSDSMLQTVGIKINSLRAKVSIAPNPFQNQLHISLLNFDKPLLISLYDLQGKLILRQNSVGKTTIVLSTTSLNAGVYLLELSSADESVSYKVEKQ